MTNGVISRVLTSNRQQTAPPRRGSVPAQPLPNDYGFVRENGNGLELRFDAADFHSGALDQSVVGRSVRFNVQGGRAIDVLLE